MRLYVNLIPALAQALVTMFFNMAGLTGMIEMPSQKQQVASHSVAYREINWQNSHVFVAINGQVILSNGFGKGNLEWKIPNTTDTKQVN